MAIKGATFDLQTVLAKYDGAMYNALSNNHNGYVSWTGAGNPITFTDTNVLTLKNGYILIHGRLIVVDGATDIILNPGSSISSGDGRLVLQIDTSKTNTQTVLNQVEILQEYKATSASWRALSTDDINALSTGVYEVQLCHFTVANGTSSGVQIDISTDTIIGNLQADIETLADNLENAFPVSIDRGGTGGTSRLAAQRNLMLPASNNTTLIEGTSAQIGAMGLSVCYYNKAQYTGSHPEALPTNWGVLVSFCNTYNDEWHQFWLPQGGGNMYRRSGNSASTPSAVTWTKMPNSPVPIADGGTGATTLNSAQTSLGIFTGLGTIIPSGSDLNNYTTIGIYSVNSWNNAQNIANIPEKNAGKLIVFNTIGTDTTALGQLYITHGHNHVYYRNRASSAWNGEWGLIGAGDIMKVTYQNEALTGLQAKQMAVDSLTKLRGSNFGVVTHGNRYITLEPGLYRIHTNFRANPGANGFIKTCLKIGNTSTLFVITDQFYAGAGCGTNASIIGVNATDVIKITANTSIYFLVMSQNNTDGCEGSLTIERLG